MFPLQVNEVLEEAEQPYRTVAPETVLRIEAIRPFVDKKDGKEIKRFPGDEWLIYGPTTYIPRVEERVNAVEKSIIIKKNQALQVRAKKNFTDRNGQKRYASETWLIKQPGAYLLDVCEEQVDILKAYILTDKQAIHIRAKANFTDVYGVERKNGQEWLVTNKMNETHILDVHEELVQYSNLVVLNQRQYAVVMNPVVDGKNQWGVKVIRNEVFFLQPGEKLEGGIRNTYILTENQNLYVRANHTFKDEKGQEFKAGESFLVKGPCTYIPPIEVEILQERPNIQLSHNEGIYVQRRDTGEVRLIQGPLSYCLEPSEDLWEKHLDPQVEECLFTGYQAPSKDEKGGLKYEKGQGKIIDRTRVVTLKCGLNTAVQLYDSKTNESEIVYGPYTIMLKPHHSITMLSLSGDVPKREGVIKTLALELGPTTMRDKFVVETSDHAKLNLSVTYKWRFVVNKESKEEGNKMFLISDFIGDACKQMASRIRGYTSGIAYKAFSENYQQLIQDLIFKDKATGLRKPFAFKTNNLIIEDVNCDEGLVPVDKSIEESLSRSLSQSFEIQSRAQKLQAEFSAMKLQQEKNGQLERLRLKSEIENEKDKIDLERQKAETEGVRSTGASIAEAKSKAEADKIYYQNELERAEQIAKAKKFEHDNELILLQKRYESEINHIRQTNELEIKSAKELAQIEADKFKNIVQAIGPETIKAIARSGPETQAKLLKGLGLKGFIISDGKNPINLFNTANGMLGGMSGAHALPQ